MLEIVHLDECLDRKYNDRRRPSIGINFTVKQSDRNNPLVVKVNHLDGKSGTVHGYHAGLGVALWIDGRSYMIPYEMLKQNTLKK